MPARATPSASTGDAPHDRWDRALQDAQASPSRTPGATNSTARVVRPRAIDDRGQRHGAAALGRRAPQAEHDQGSQRERLQEHVEVCRGAGEAAQGEERARHEGAGAARPELSQQGVGPEGRDRELQRQEEGEGDRPGEEDVQEVQDVEVGQREGALEDVRIPDRPASLAKLLAPRKTARDRR